MSYASAQAAVVRIPTVVVKLIPDYCLNTFGQSPCAATGTPCYYTYPTCRDQSAFQRGSKDYCFCARVGPLVGETLPYLAKLAAVPTEIKTDQHVTRVGEISLEFDDDLPLRFANPDKSVTNSETGGTFWRNWLARNSNFRGRPCEIYFGFADLNWPSDYRLVFRGILDNVEISEGRCEIMVKDFLKKLEVKIPSRQSSSNQLTAPYVGGAQMHVADALEFPDSGIVKINDPVSGNEYVVYTGRDTVNHCLNGCAPGRYGSTSVSHAGDCEVSSMAIFAEPADGSGIPADRAFLDLLVTHGGISGLEIAVKDKGITLSSAAGAADTSLNVNGLISRLPDSGIVRIADELIRYGAKAGGEDWITVDEEAGPQTSDHNCDQGLGNEGYHWVKFSTGPSTTAMDRVSLWLKRTNVLAGVIYLSLFEDISGHPGSILDQTLGTIYLAQLSDTYSEQRIYKHIPVVPNTNYWLRCILSVWSGSGEVVQAMESSALTTEYAHSSTPNYQPGTWIPIAGLPWFRVEAINTIPPKLQQCLRGQYGTTPASHSAGSQVLLTEFSDEVGTWLASCRYQRFVGKPTPVHQLATELRQATLGQVWQGEDSRIHFKCAPRPLFAPGVSSLNDRDHLIHRSAWVDQNEEARKTRITVHYDPGNDDPGENADDYRQHYLHLDLHLEDPNYYSEPKNQEMFFPWVDQANEGRNAADHLLMRFRYGAPILHFSLELKDAAGLGVGDFVMVETDLVTGPDGRPLRDALYEITRKKQKADGSNAFEFTALMFANGIGGNGLGGRSCVISPLSYTNDYDFYSEEDHSIYGWISDASLKVGAADDPGYSIS